MSIVHDYATPDGLAAWSANAPAIYANVPFSAYLKHPVISRSALMDMLDSTPAHYRYNRDHPDHTPTEAMVWGSAVHCKLQEPAEFSKRYRPGPRSPQKGKESQPAGFNTITWANAQREADADGVVLYSESWDVDGMAAAVLNDRDASRVLGGRAMVEATLIWNDPKTGLLCKARPDSLRLNGRIFSDIKTCASANPREFARSAEDNGYLEQAAHYRMGLRVLTGTDFDPFIIAVEKGGSHAVAVYEITDTELSEGERRVEYALGLIAKCERTGQWPGYQLRTLYASQRWHKDLEFKRGTYDDVTAGEDPNFMAGESHDRSPLTTHAG